MNGYDGRKSTRYYGEIPIELNQGSGLTRDYSVDGVYFMTDQQLSVGEQIEFVMLLNHQGSGNVVRLNCRADVVRVDPSIEKTGAAVAITKHVFEAAPELAEAAMDKYIKSAGKGDTPLRQMHDL